MFWLLNVRDLEQKRKNKRGDLKPPLLLLFRIKTTSHIHGLDNTVIHYAICIFIVYVCSLFHICTRYLDSKIKDIFNERSNFIDTASVFMLPRAEPTQYIRAKLFALLFLVFDSKGNGEIYFVKCTGLTTRFFGSMFITLHISLRDITSQFSDASLLYPA